MIPNLVHSAKCYSYTYFSRGHRSVVCAIFQMPSLPLKTYKQMSGTKTAMNVRVGSASGGTVTTGTKRPTAHRQISDRCHSPPPLAPSLTPNSMPQPVLQHQAPPMEEGGGNPTDAPPKKKSKPSAAAAAAGGGGVAPLPKKVKKPKKRKVCWLVGIDQHLLLPLCIYIYIFSHTRIRYYYFLRK